MGMTMRRFVKWQPIPKQSSYHVEGVRASKECISVHVHGRVSVWDSKTQYCDLLCRARRIWNSRQSSVTMRALIFFRCQCLI